jgi:hypothetical protein
MCAGSPRSRRKLPQKQQKKYAKRTQKTALALSRTRFSPKKRTQTNPTPTGATGGLPASASPHVEPHRPPLWSSDHYRDSNGAVRHITTPGATRRRCRPAAPGCRRCGPDRRAGYARRTALAVVGKPPAAPRAWHRPHRGTGFPAGQPAAGRPRPTYARLPWLVRQSRHGR